MKTIYILLMRSKTILSSLIHLATKEPYTHVSLALDRPLSRMYSFSRHYPYLLLPAGFMHERPGGAMFRRLRRCPCALYSLEVTPAAYARIEETIARFERERSRYRFNILGVVSCRFGVPFEREYKYFCSQFVSKTLRDSGAADIPCAPGVMHPVDFLKIKGLTKIYEGAVAHVADLGEHPDKPEERAFPTAL